MNNEVKPCPFCGEEIKAIAVLCRFCGALLTASKEAYAGGTQRGKAIDMSCPKCRSVHTSEFMEGRWQCLNCGARFVYERAPTVLVQPTTERIIHTGPVNVNGLQTDVRGVSGIPGGAGKSKEKVCPRCGSKYVNPVGNHKMNCHNCGHTFSTLGRTELALAIICIVIVIFCVLKGC